jgi:hypothetical protein
MGVEDGDRLMAAQITDGTGEVFIGTRDGVAIRFPKATSAPWGGPPTVLGDQPPRGR